jgi:hypothetical protein
VSEVIVEKKTVQVPKELSVAEQIATELANYSGAAVILVPDGDQGMKVYYRSGKTGGGGAWWLASYNEASESGHMDSELRGKDKVFLLAREDVDNFLSGRSYIREGI